jgi:hypothetical protein
VTASVVDVLDEHGREHGEEGEEPAARPDAEQQEVGPGTAGREERRFNLTDRPVAGVDVETVTGRQRADVASGCEHDTNRRRAT